MVPWPRTAYPLHPLEIIAATNLGDRPEDCRVPIAERYETQNATTLGLGFSTADARAVKRSTLYVHGRGGGGMLQHSSHLDGSSACSSTCMNRPPFSRSLRQPSYILIRRASPSTPVQTRRQCAKQSRLRQQRTTSDAFVPRNRSAARFATTFLVVCPDLGAVQLKRYELDTPCRLYTHRGIWNAWYTNLPLFTR